MRLLLKSITMNDRVRVKQGFIWIFSVQELTESSKAELMSEIVIFAVTILYAIAVVTRHSGLKRKTGNAAFGECGEIQRLYEEKLGEYMRKLK